MSTSGISTTSSAPSSRLDAVVAHVVASAAATSTADLDFSGIGDPAKISAAHPAQLHNFVNGEWTAGTAKTMELPDPMNGETFMKMPLTETDAELQPFLQKMAQVPKSGLHNPLKNTGRYVKYGQISFRLASELAKPAVADHFTRLIQRCVPKSYAQAMGE